MNDSVTSLLDAEMRRKLTLDFFGGGEASASKLITKTLEAGLTLQQGRVHSKLCSGIISMVDPCIYMSQNSASSIDCLIIHGGRYSPVKITRMIP